MKTPMNSPEKCPNCGKTLPRGVLSGLCPTCLLAQGAETEPGGAAGPERFDPPSLEAVAALFPQLEILGLLGAGGMGAVYQARQPALDRWVALKVLPAGGGGGPAFEERFNREARALARLNHPHIVAVHEFGCAGTLHYFIMEYVDGPNLRQLERSGRLTAREALQIIPQICDALQYAHDQGVVHRDIKPENVLVDRRGRVKIADFGLAKILGRDQDAVRLTVEGQVMGTPHYMAPEQLARPLTVDHRADIYSLGVVFYEMLTGELPLGHFEPPSRKVEVDVRLDEVVLRALENDPVRRFQKASEVRTRVETIAEAPNAPDSPKPAHPPATYHGWLGFAVVAEEGGRRRISWKGTAAAFGTALGLISIPMALVTFAAGESLWGWFGVRGWASVLVRLAFAVGFTALGVRLAFRKRSAGEPLSPGRPGNVLLESARPGWRRARSWGLVPLLVLGFGLLLQKASVFRPAGFNAKRGGDSDGLGVTRWLNSGPRLNSGQPLAGDSASISSTDPGVRNVALSNGGVLRLLAVGDGASGSPGTWWRPDGTSMPGVQFALSGAAGSPSVGGTRPRELVFQTVGVDFGKDRPVFDGEPALNPSFSGAVTENGGAVKGGWALRDAWASSVKSGTIRIGFPEGAWRTIRTWLPRDGSRTAYDDVRDPDWGASIERVTDPGTGVAVVARLDAGSAGLSDGTGLCRFLTPGPQAKNWRLRFRLLDRNGEEHVHGIATSTAPDGDTLRHLLWHIEFPDVSLAQVVRVEIQVQRLDWIEFADVALEPRTGAPQFGPVHEMEVAALLDLDTGKIGEFPPAKPGTAVFDLSENLSFMQEHGFDAEAGVNGINLLGVRILRLPSADWDRLDAAELLRRMETVTAYPGSVGEEGGGASWEWIYGFRTREGGVGLLQILRYREKAPGAILRFKTVTSAKPIP
ncbi:MAG: serine/threonine-protein kinase [Verrucomicrobiota bacterium]